MHGLMISRSGNVPMISAPAGPVKLRPDKPGGMQIPNRDKLVYERIRSGKVALETELVERLLPQPEKPVSMPWSGSKKEPDPLSIQEEVPIRSKSVPHSHIWAAGGAQMSLCCPDPVQTRSARSEDSSPSTA